MITGRPTRRYPALTYLESLAKDPNYTSEDLEYQVTHLSSDRASKSYGDILETGPGAEIVAEFDRGYHSKRNPEEADALIEAYRHMNMKIECGLLPKGSYSELKDYFASKSRHFTMGYLNSWSRMHRSLRFLKEFKYLLAARSVMKNE